MKYSIYNDLCAGRFVVQPEFTSQGGVSYQNYLTFLGLTLNAASVIDGNRYARFSVEHQQLERDGWRRLPPVKPRNGTRLVEVDAMIDVGLVEAGQQYGEESWANAGWAALVTETSPTAINLGQGWMPKGTKSVLCIDLCVRWDSQGIVQLPVAQYVIPLDARGKALEGIDPRLIGCWGATIFCSDEQSNQVRLLVRRAIFPILLGLAAENGDLPGNLRPGSIPPEHSNFAIRDAILKGNYTYLDRTPSEMVFDDHRESPSFAERVAIAPFFDASNEARAYLLDELKPNYDWRSLPSLIPPKPTIYVEVEPPDLFLNEDGIIRPFSVLEGAGTRWSALVQHARTAQEQLLYIILNVQDDESSPPRCHVAFTIAALQRNGRAATESRSSLVTGAFAQRDHPNVSMWLQPIIRRLAAFHR